MGSVALLGAGVIAANPMAAAPALMDIQHRAVTLAAAVDVTDSVADAYGDLFTNTSTNLSYLASIYSASPFPLLSQLAANQEGYAAELTAAIQAIPANLETWWNVGGGESKAGSVYLANIQAALQAGDFFTAYDNFNKLALFGFQQLTAPIYGVLLSSTPRGGGALNMGIIQQMAQNFADAVGVVFNSSTVVFQGFQSVFAPTSGANFAFARALTAVSDAFAAGDVEGGFTALVNTPASIADALLNGFDYDADGTTNPWSGFLSSNDNCTGRCAGDGTVYTALLTIPKAIAAAIANPVAATTLAKTAEDTTASKATSVVESTDTTDEVVTEGTTESGVEATETTPLAEVAPVKSEAVVDATASASASASASDTDGATTVTKPVKPVKKASSVLKKVAESLGFKPRSTKSTTEDKSSSSATTSSTSSTSSSTASSNESKTKAGDDSSSNSGEKKSDSDS